MKNKPFLQKLSKNKFAIILLIIFLLIAFILSIIVIVQFISDIGPKQFISATKLDEKPTSYFPFSKLEPYNIQSIFETNSSVEVDSKVFTDISNVLNTYQSGNVEYNSNYFELNFMFLSINPDFSVLLPYQTVAFVSGFLLVSIFLIKINTYFNQRQIEREKQT